MAEWFISQTGRAAAASEQTMGVPYGTGVLLHGEARRHIHNAVYGLLEALGYACEWTGSLTVRIKEERRQEPSTLAADAHRHRRRMGPDATAGRGERGPRG